MLCAMKDARTATGVWTEPGNEHAGAVHVLVCNRHAEDARTKGWRVRPLRNRRRVTVPVKTRS
jgi:hypothetical protein